MLEYLEENGTSDAELSETNIQAPQHLKYSTPSPLPCNSKELTQSCAILPRPAWIHLLPADPSSILISCPRTVPSARHSRPIPPQSSSSKGPRHAAFPISRRSPLRPTSNRQNSSSTIPHQTQVRLDKIKCHAEVRLAKSTDAGARPEAEVEMRALGYRRAEGMSQVLWMFL
ncbi:hypothetical protein HBI12_070310 [Parastagonospora nodorum]|nr:hypothetical protein HBI12_070310 [Parastagonospora nodorum]